MVRMGEFGLDNRQLLEIYLGFNLKEKLKKITVTLFTFLYVAFIFASSEESYFIQGRILENQSKAPVAYATVMLKDISTNKVLTGTTSAEDGSFKIETNSTRVYLEISFIGFKIKKVENLNFKSRTVELGDVFIEQDQQLLNEVEVVGEKSQTEFKLDKRVFNVGKDLSSTGASALEVLNNVPSVNVNIEGQVSLRGSSGVQILINGKPSVLADDESNALGSITAEMIEKVEVITNPSAKYEAEGTAGIINIIIKKEERKGVNGSVSFNTGWPHNHSIGLSMNRRTEKFNLISQFGVGYRELPNYNENINQDRLQNTSLFSEGEEYRNEQFYNVILGADYHIDSTKLLTVSGSFAYEIEDQPSETDFLYEDGEGTLIEKWERTEVTEADNPKYQYEVRYSKDYKDHEDHLFSLSAIGNLFWKEQSSEFSNKYDFGGNGDDFQRTSTDFGEVKYTFNADYTKPIDKVWKIETGAQYVIQDVKNDYQVANLTNGAWVLDPNLTNNFEYQQGVLGIYGTGAYEKDKWGLKLGLRAEQTDLNTYLVTTDERNELEFLNLFPSAHSSYKVSKQLSFQAGYSRRIYRPRLWDLNPFFNIRNNFSVRTGNPNLQPEYTDSYELNTILILEEVTQNFGLYYRYTTDVIERISIFQNGVTTFRPENIGTNSIIGLEYNYKLSPKKWMSINGDLNYNIFQREGQFNQNSFDFVNDRWSTKMSTKIKLQKSWDIELTGNYTSGFQTVQGETQANVFMDFGIRKKMMKGKAIVNLSIRDVFFSRFHKIEIVQENFYVSTFRQRGRFITLGFSYGFGKGEAMQYSGGRRR